MRWMLRRFKKRVVNSASRRLGEGFVQPLFYKIYNHRRPIRDDSFDGLDVNDEKFEYKSVRALFPSGKDKDLSLYDEFMTPADTYGRLAKMSDIENSKVVVNVQNIKPHTFDWLIYTIISQDGFDVYKIKKEELEEKVESGEFPNWSKGHGREDKEGRNCQFPITSENLKWHEQYKIDHFDWKEIAGIAKEIHRF